MKSAEYSRDRILTTAERNQRNYSKIEFKQPQSEISGLNLRKKFVNRKMESAELF